MSLYSFFDKYYLEPIRLDSGYNIFNTLTYAAIAIAGLYLIFLGLRKLKINFDSKFFFAVLPFVILGSSLRAFTDHGFVGYGFWFVTPGIYIWVILLAVICILISFAVSKFFKKSFTKVLMTEGIVLAVLNFIFFFSKLKFTNLFYGFLIVLFAVLSSLAVYFVAKKLKAIWLTEKISFLPVATHLFDASATFVAVDFLGALEKHPLPRLLTNFTGSAVVMYALKLAVLLPAVYLISKEIKDKELKNFTLVMIALLGFALGFRDLLTMILL